jgi:hypothetical protein
MRYYAVARPKDGRPSIEAEVTEPYMIEEYSHTLTRSEIEADPEFVRALADWVAGDDRLKAIEKAHYLLKQYGLDIIHGADEVEETVAAISGIEDPRYDAIRQALPHLKEAAALLTPLVEAMPDAHPAAV